MGKIKPFGLLIILITLATVTTMANNGYMVPSEKIQRIVDAPNPPQISISPAGRVAILVENTTQLTLEDLAEPMAKVGGIRILKRYNIPRRNYYAVGFNILDLKTGKTTPVDLPQNARFGFPTWSPDGKLFGAALYSNKGSKIWMFDPETGKGKAVTPPRLNSALLTPFKWSRDSKSIYVGLWPKDRKEEPMAPLLPNAPIIGETSGRVSQVRTFQDLIRNDHDAKLFKYYCTSQLYRIDIKNGKKKPLGKPGIFSHISSSPDENYLLVRKIKKPFSRVVPYYRFPHVFEIWDADGNKVKTLAKLPAGEDIPIEGVREGVRNIFWMRHHPASLCWFEALDGGDPNVDVEYRDVMKILKSPFKSKPREVIKLPERYAGMGFFEQENLAIIRDYNRDKRWITERLIEVDKKNIASESKIVFSRNRFDQYSDPGSFVYRSNLQGESFAILEDGQWAYLEGSGATPKGYMPFLHRFNIFTGEKQEIFVSSSESFESFIDFADSDLKTIITARENPQNPRNYFKRAIKDNLSAGKAEPITSFPSPTPELDNVKKELIRYERNDGVPLSGTLYYPLDYTPGKTYPTIVWAYPREYTDKSTAGQVRAATNRYARISGSSILFFTLRGYAVLNSAEIPIVGDPLKANDTFVEQIRAGAEAAVNKLVDMGIADPKRIGVAGHSYGGFMVANLLAHTDLFAAGIARSGAYNRTLTPFGFQGERRTFWEAPDIYMNISAFSHANKINQPLLLIHGEIDPNPGTFPMQTERLFAAIRGHGGTARKVIMPFEGHGYEARESILHVLQEMFDWFDKYL